MKETSQLTHTGQQPAHTLHTQHTRPHGLAPTQTITQALGHTKNKEPPSSFDCLFEKVLELLENTAGQFPYIGPAKHMEFLECFCDIFSMKESDVSRDKANLTAGLETISNTQQQVEIMKETVKELKKRHEEATHSSANLLQELTAISCQLERLKALLGHGSSVLSAMQMVGEQERILAENEDDDVELLALFGDRRSTRYDALLQKLREQLSAAETEELAAKQRMLKSKERALHWQGKIDRNTIDQIKSLNNPPRLVGTIMELMFTLLRQYGEQDGDSTQSTPGHMTSVGSALPRKRTSAMGSSGTETARMEREQWLAIQSSVGDSQRFLDLLNRLKWQEGLSGDAVKLIESKLDTSSGGGVAGGGVASSSHRASTSGKDLVTVAMARHAAESAASMCAFAVSIVSYTHSLQPYKLALEKLQQ